MTKPFKLLFVEDVESEIEGFEESIAVYMSNTRRNIDMVACGSLEEARQIIDNSYDGAIIDLRLGANPQEGNDVIESIVSCYFRIPIAILTGTPDTALKQYAHIGVFKKGEASHKDILDALWDVYDTGLTRIMGGRGKIEEILSKVFQENLLPQKDIWIKYGRQDSPKTEKALLRHALGHLVQLLDSNDEQYYPEELFIYPPLSTGVQTGTIIKKLDSERCFVILSPSCDLVLRDGKCNTDHFLLVEIDTLSSAFPNINFTEQLSNTSKRTLREAYRNNGPKYYHWLPKVDFFDGGFINFRKIISVPKSEFSQEYEEPYTQISPVFVKDIVARLSSFYARQGQPNIDHSYMLDH